MPGVSLSDPFPLDGEREIFDYNYSGGPRIAGLSVTLDIGVDSFFYDSESTSLGRATLGLEQNTTLDRISVFLNTSSGFGFLTFEITSLDSSFINFSPDGSGVSFDFGVAIIPFIQFTDPVQLRTLRQYNNFSAVQVPEPSIITLSSLFITLCAVHRRRRIIGSSQSASFNAPTKVISSRDREG
jgi:hypothetical protein